MSKEIIVFHFNVVGWDILYNTKACTVMTHVIVVICYNKTPLKLVIVRGQSQ